MLLFLVTEKDYDNLVEGRNKEYNIFLKDLKHNLYLGLGPNDFAFHIIKEQQKP